MSFFRNMDLYKAIVLLSLVLLPAGGWMVKLIDDDLVACKKAIHDATKAGGVVEEIGSLQRKVEVVIQNQRGLSDAINAPRTYFEEQILAAGGSGLKTNDFQPSEPKEESVTLKSKQRIVDYVADVTWPRKELLVSMDFVYAVLFNCESGARQAGDQVQQSVWKLRELTLVNSTDERTISGHNTPPPELLDKWRITNMKFARREPRKGS